MKRFVKLFPFFLLLGTAALALAAGDPNDAPGSQDHPLLSRMPGYYIETYDVKEFDLAKLYTGPNQKGTEVEGRCTRIQYRANDYEKRASGVQILRNYQNALQKIGAKMIYAGETYETLQLNKSGAETWVMIETGDAWYKLTIVEKQAMQQDVLADAASMAGSLRDTGKVALYGIYFDSGKSAVKPESDATLKEIAKLLKNDAKLKLYVVGHTDNMGTLDYNLKLSKDRADAVVKALTSQYGVAAARLAAAGVGPLCPVATNATEAGRALNRRVELVAQ